MGDMGDYWKDVKPFLKERSKKRKAAHLEYAAKMLDRNGVAYQRRNEGLHFMVDSQKGTIDYYPTTGVWRPRNGDRGGRGIAGLLRYMGIVKEPHNASI